VSAGQHVGEGALNPIPSDPGCCHNGLLLSALWDAAFDKGLISFADDGTPLLSPSLTKESRAALLIETVTPIRGLRAEHHINLARHRACNGF
jgi:hypothetical protein